VQDRIQLARIYREARGFIMLSAWESLSLSALEAAACECPLLLSDLPWAHSAFKEHAKYCPIASPERTAGYLRKFYDQSPSLEPPPKPLNWIEVARQLGRIYASVLDKKS
jgi:glycosyltransferase involved in cell wall biosynthesis